VLFAELAFVVLFAELAFVLLVRLSLRSNSNNNTLLCLHLKKNRH
jgi:hypothetical protein